MCDREQASVPSFFLQLSHRTTQACQDARNKDGTSNRDPLEISKVSAPDTSVLHVVRPSTKQGPYPGTSWASTNIITATPSGPPPYRTSVRPQDRHKALAGQNTGARVIITKLSRWDGSRPRRTEASSRSALHAAIDPYSNIYACTLCLSLEL